MWHASVSIWDRQGTRKLHQPALAEKEAVRLLTGVGGECEWWIHTHLGHLRIPVTADEYRQVPPGCVLADAGESGTQRPRTHLK